MVSVAASASADTQRVCRLGHTAIPMVDEDLPLLVRKHNGIEDQNAVMKPVASTFPRTTAPHTGLSHLHVRAWCRQSSRFASGSRQTRFLSS